MLNSSEVAHVGKLSISSKIPTIPLGFWDELYKAEKLDTMYGIKV